MEHSRKQKLLVVLALVIAIASLSIGFAAFSVSLNISPSASVTPNSDSFSVKFSTVASQLSTGPIVAFDISSETGASHGIIDNSAAPTVSNLKATFKRPGQYVEYYFYARNEGEYTAYLNSVNFLGNKTCTGASDTTDALVQSACESINIFVTIDDLVYSETTAVSSHALETGKSNLIKVRLEYASNGSYVDGTFSITFPNISLLYSTVDDSTFVSNTSPSVYTLNSKLLSLDVKSDQYLDVNSDWAGDVGFYLRYNSANNDNPIYYFRGDVDNNNIIFADKCWLVVRTTETGGTKIIYNGTPTADNKCYGDNSIIGYSPYNENYSVADDVSYLYSDGRDSTIKQVIDAWYAENMMTHAHMLEDTVWCNDRTISESGFHDEGGWDYTFYNPMTRVNNGQVLLECPAEYSLTVSAINISNKLTYPIALLTSDELMLSGQYLSDNYLNNNQDWWTMSPDGYECGEASVFRFYPSGSSIKGLQVNYVYANAVRPAVSLKPGTIVSSGDGTSTNPYIIE